MNSKCSRTCVGCGETFDKKSLIRIVRNTDGLILVDETGRMNGRGAYICPSAECLDKAFKKHGLDRAFKTTVPKEALESISEYIKEHAT
ncbi:MAG: YlxR family protein [Lachnospiraceae bacterium]|nr:YlxR family protein [Lachnospiraceae bacterium]